jgi:molybdate transport system substrate-binding protein
MVLAKVALGEADAGFVYATDAAASDRVRAIEIPAGENVVAEYPIGVLEGATAPETARAFVSFVLGPEGRALLRRHGFRL